MHTLEAECRELEAAGVVDEGAATRAVALERGEVFPVAGEIRLVLYGAVLAITSGLGIVLKDNIDRIGPVSLIVGLALVAAVCYASAIRTRLRGETRSIGGDYVLLLGALLVSADLGYAESQFHWLGPHWSRYLLVLAAIHGTTAYALSSRLVLSVSLASLAGWFGVSAQPEMLFRPDDALRRTGVSALLCAGLILLWREVHRRAGGIAEFGEVFAHFAANVAFWGALALTFAPGTRLAGTVALLAIGAVSIGKGLRDREEAFAVYGVVYTAVGLCFVVVQPAADGVLAALLCLGIVTAAAVALWRLHALINPAAN